MHASRTAALVADGAEAPLEDASPDALVLLHDGFSLPNASPRASPQPSLDAVDDGGGLGVQIAYASQVRDQRRGESCAGRARETGDGERFVGERCGGGVNPGGKGAETAGERGIQRRVMVSFSAVDTTPND